MHLIAHSMGAHVLMNALPTIAPLFAKPEECTPPAAPGSDPEGMDAAEDPNDLEADPNGVDLMSVGSCILIHPDYPLSRFVKRDFDILRGMCRNITLIADTDDTALMASQMLNRELALGKQPFALHRYPAPEMQAALQQQPETLLGYAAAILHQLREDGLGFRPEAPEGVAMLDMDVIDVTWLDSNVHGARHAYFNVNRWLVDDLREILTTGKRAAQRTHRLFHRAQNVWSFLAAPKFVVTN